MCTLIIYQKHLEFVVIATENEYVHKYILIYTSNRIGAKQFLTNLYFYVKYIFFLTKGSAFGVDLNSNVFFLLGLQFHSVGLSKEHKVYVNFTRISHFSLKIGKPG